jgi:7-cyano-7-deazaguanine reductase
MQNNDLSHLPLGKSVTYIEQYSPALLQAVPRYINREKIGLTDSQLPFTGEDFWTGYELSWLNPKGKPQVGLLTCQVPYDSPNLIESKSFKLYLNSFNQSVFENLEHVERILSDDLSRCANANVKVKVTRLSDAPHLKLTALSGECIDDLDIEVTDYQVSANLLSTHDKHVTETLHSHLLKSNCLVTGQPDWASVIIRYQGKQMDKSGLLKYLISFRQHNEFHEQCVERIFTDIMIECHPENLTVCARFTRRGGLDINPFRSNFEQPYPNLRTIRQ